LRLGYLSEGSELDSARAVLVELRRSLLANERVRAELRRTGFDDATIELRACETPQAMIRYLDGAEFDVAFATAVIYAGMYHPELDPTAGLRRPETYRPVLQFYRPDSDVRSSRGDGVLRRAAIFIGPSSPQWTADPAAAIDPAAALEGKEIALTDWWSAPSSIYPHLKMADVFDERLPTLRRLWVDRPEEVVKHVISGLVEVGACDERTLERYGAPGGVALYRTVLLTDAMPTDPILFRAEPSPAISSGLGAELHIAILAFFSGQSRPQGSPVPGLTVVDATERAFEDMARALKRFDLLEGAPNPRGPIDRIRPTPPPAPETPDFE
jgi:ABC-type phosphate/phosphonate transport system substrate-binding protein